MHPLVPPGEQDKENEEKSENEREREKEREKGGDRLTKYKVI